MITVIIPCHNQADTLTAAVQSAMDADQIIIVDDCSSDDTADIGRDLDQRYNHVIYTETGAEVAAGVCFARNYGISHAAGGVIIPLDADCTLTPAALALADAYVPNTFIYGDWYEGSVYHKGAPIGSINRKNCAQSTFLFTKSMWRAVGGYAPRYEAGYEDWALMCAFMQAGYTPLQVGRPLVHSPGAGQRSNNARRLHGFLYKLLNDDYPEVFRAHAIKTH